MALLTAEYTLYTLYRETDLTQNPFLSHWIENYINLSRWSVAWWRAEGPGFAIAVRLYLARLTIIKSILLRKIDALGEVTPSNFVESERHNSYIAPNTREPIFSLSRFFRVVANEGSIVWRDAAALETFKESVALFMPHLKMRNAFTTASESFEDINQVLRHIKDGDSIVFYKLKKMPINEMKSLELMNELMALEETRKVVSNGPWKPPVELWSVVRDFIQHGLRQIEAMGTRQPVPVRGPGGARPEYVEHSTQDSSSASVPGPRRIKQDPPESMDAMLQSLSMMDNEEEAEEEELPLSHVGREEQIRSVRLLCLFMRNALNKNFLSPGHILLELREVSMQYIWIPEARDLAREFLHN